MAKQVDYRKLAFNHYPKACAYCGFGIPAVLEVAHIDGDHANCDLANLVVLCPTCHRMLDLDLISNGTIVEMRDRPKIPNWGKLMKDAGQKAARTRATRLATRKAAARKAIETRRQRTTARAVNP